MRKYISFLSVFVMMALIFFLSGEESFASSNDNYYAIGNSIEVKIDVLDSEENPISEAQSYYNGQSVYIKVDWRATDNVYVGTNMTLKLPVGAESGIGFESPLEKGLDIVSSDGRTKTNLRKDGSTITVYFDANDQKSINTGTSGTIRIPHNIFISKESAADINFTLISDKNDSVSITKKTASPEKGIEITDIKLYDKNEDKEATNFTELEGNIARLKLSYSGKIKNNDSVLIKFAGFESGKAKILPYSYEPINLKDNDGKVVGQLTFRSDSDGTFARIGFNDAFNGTNVKGHVGFLVEVVFSERSNTAEAIGLYVNDEFVRLSAKGPKKLRKADLTTFDYVLHGTDITRYNIIVNQEDLITESTTAVSADFSKIKDVSVTGEVEAGMVLDPESIRIVKLLATSGYSLNSLNNYWVDLETLKTAAEANSQLGSDKSLWNGQTGLTVKEFEDYSGFSTKINYKKDAEGNVTGFTLSLGDLNEAEETQGEYVSVSSGGKNQMFKRSNKAFGYLVYYNSAESEKLAVTEGKGYFKITVKDKSTKELIKDCEFQIFKKDGTKLSTIKTNQFGSVVSPSLEIGDYYLTQLKAPAGYKLFEGKTNVAINSSTVINSIDIYNYGEAEVEVIATVNDQISAEVSGTKFDLYAYDNRDNVIKTITLDSNGRGTAGLLPFGRYYIVESGGGSGLSLDNKEIPVISSYEKLNTSGKIGVGLNYVKDTAEEYLILDEITPLGKPNISQGEQPAEGGLISLEEEVLPEATPDVTVLPADENSAAESFEAEVTEAGAEPQVPETSAPTTQVDEKGNPITGDSLSLMSLFPVTIILAALIGAKLFINRKGQEILGSGEDY